MTGRFVKREELTSTHTADSIDGNLALKADAEGNPTISAETAAKIDKEVSLLVEQAYATALNILGERTDRLVAISEHLIQVETIDGSELDEMLFAA